MGNKLPKREGISDAMLCALIGAPTPKRIEEEHNIQVNCVKWFRLQYRNYSSLLFAIPNGGFRGKATAGKLKAEGVVAGVADLCLAIPRGGYGALYIEMKQRGGYQRPVQKEWQKICERVGNRYVVCRTIEEFMKEINYYMSLPLNGRVQ